MANYRPIHCKIWSDPQFEALSPEAKLLFFHLLTNSLRMSSGLYVITLRRMAQETGMAVDRVKQALGDICEAGMVKYDDAKSVVWIVNALKYIQDTPQMRKSVINDLVFNAESCLVGELLKKHPCVRSWPEFTENVRFELDSHDAKNGWKEDDGEVPF